MVTVSVKDPVTISLFFPDRQIPVKNQNSLVKWNLICLKSI